MIKAYLSKYYLSSIYEKKKVAILVVINNASNSLK